ncbi:extracellular solute-binding protein [Rhizobium rhizoryzae]|uniref:Multiple sugar transport system substrate-binding protein n=1 Tax=Rhizobium rhizoryzae TaxID=451876 RepID=A0A7W6LM20_9HYPH|nr:extracellular solute-binding protein [Rhizobium rhizoryzae]MBB4145747.1 multiple sugar transport system substrate-binding protein [Rhizobium rhizoryzae]
MTQFINRRSLLKTGAGLGAGLVTGALGMPARAQEKQLTFAVWGGDAEVAGYKDVIAKFESANPGVKVKLDVMPFAQFYQQVDTRLAGRQAPDIFRVTYQQIGRYATNKAAIDLTQYLDKDFGKGFTPAVWSAVNVKGIPYALPHHTDTFALFYNAELLEKAGISVPTSLDQAWTWAAFIDNAKKLKAQGGASYPFAMSWQNGAVHRWMFYLYQHGGRLLNDDLTASRITEKAGIETITWTQSWFTEGLVPPSTSVKSAEKVQNLFANGTIAMMLNGNWQIPFVEQQMKAKWGVTYLPRDVAMADDLGGTCVAVSRDSKTPELAAEFVKFLVNEENMRSFVDKAQLLPVRSSIVDKGIEFSLRPKEMKVFVDQTKTIPEHLVSTVIHPNWGKFNPKMADELDLAFTSGQSPEQTAKNIEAHIERLLLRG